MNCTILRMYTFCSEILRFQRDRLKIPVPRSQLDRSRRLVHKPRIAEVIFRFDTKIRAVRNVAGDARFLEATEHQKGARRNRGDRARTFRHGRGELVQPAGVQQRTADRNRRVDRAVRIVHAHLDPRVAKNTELFVHVLARSVHHQLFARFRRRTVVAIIVFSRRCGTISLLPRTRELN